MKIFKTKRDIVYICAIAVLVIALTVVSVLSIIGKREAEEDKSYYDLKCESYAVQNANLAEGQIVFIGDSITDLYVLDDYYADLPLATYNRGIGGDTTEGVLNRLKVSLFDIKPSKVVLMIGTNDVNAKRENAEILDTYRDIVDEIYRELPEVELYCMSIIPQGEALGTFTGVDVELSTEKILALNTEIEKIVTQKGGVYVDIFSALAYENNYLIEKYTSDALHLNDEGFKVWTAALKPKLQ